MLANYFQNYKSDTVLDSEFQIGKSLEIEIFFYHFTHCIFYHNDNIYFSLHQINIKMLSKHTQTCRYNLDSGSVSTNPYICVSDSQYCHCTSILPLFNTLLYNKKSKFKVSFQALMKYHYGINISYNIKIIVK